MFLITFINGYDNDKFVAEFMRLWQIAHVYGFQDCNGVCDIKVYRLTPDKDPEQLFIQEGTHDIALFTKTGEQVTGYTDWPVH